MWQHCHCSQLQARTAVWWPSHLFGVSMWADCCDRNGAAIASGDTYMIGGICQLLT